jgi:hypothetical protein
MTQPESTGLVARIFQYTQNHLLGALLWIIGTSVVAGVLSDYVSDRLIGTKERVSTEAAAVEAPTGTVTKPQPTIPPVVTGNDTSTKPLQSTPGAVNSESSSRSRPVFLTALGSRPLVHILNQQGRHEPLVGAEVARALDGDAGAFATTFVTAGAFARAFDGDASDLRTIQGIASVPLVVLGRFRVAYSSNESLSPGLRKAATVLDLRIYRPGRGFSTQVLQLDATGAGFSDREGLLVAIKNLAVEVKTNVR